MEAKPLSQRTILFLVSLAGHWSLVLWTPAGWQASAPCWGIVMGRYITVTKVAGEGDTQRRAQPMRWLELV